MRILLANDDGIFSTGLAAMERALRRLGEVCPAAPATEQSGVGPAITFLNPLSVKKAYRNGKLWGYAVEGTPVDCVKIGIAELAGGIPDMVVSGINNGLNVGINVLYSGTVAAVQESAWRGIPSFAVSTQFTDCQPGAKLERAAELAAELIRVLMERPYVPGTLYNINIPFAALEDGADLTPAFVPVDMSIHWASYEKRHDPTFRRYYWLADRPNPNPVPADGVPATDMEAVAAGKISVSPITINPTDTRLLNDLKESCPVPNPDFKFSEVSETASSDFQLFRWIDRPRG